MEIRCATERDLPAIVRLLADDPLGEARERPVDPVPSPYIEAFRAIERQPGNRVLVAVEQEDVIGCLQLTLVPGLSRLGVLRAQIEGVRVARAHRGCGVGKRLVGHAIEEARRAGSGLIELTSSKERIDARRFYARLGFVESHVGMKLELEGPSPRSVGG